MAFGVWGLLANADQTHPGSWVRWFAGGLIAHDAVFAPAVFAIGVAATRIVPRWARPGLQAAFLVAGAVVLMALPLLLGFGQRPDNTTLQPLDYGPRVAVLVGGISVVAAADVARRAIRRRRTDGD